MKLEKQKSKIDGVGIFTNKKIDKGDVFYIIPLSKTYNSAKPKCAKIGERLWVCDEEVLNFVNHSCEPNSILSLDKTPCLIAKRDVEVGEEITVDYSLTEKHQTRIKCKCGSEHCKKFFYIET